MSSECVNGERCDGHGLLVYRTSYDGGRKTVTCECYMIRLTNKVLGNLRKTISIRKAQ